MKTIKVKGMDIKVPKGSSFNYDTPEHLPKGHMISCAIGKRGMGKSTSMINLLMKMNYDRIFIISPTFKSNSELMKLLDVNEEDVYENPDDVSCVDAIVKKIEKERDDLKEYREHMKEYRRFLRLLNDPMAQIPDELLIMFYDNGQFKPPQHKYNGRRPFMACLVDDCQGSKLFTSKKLDKLTIRHRHIGAFEDDTPSLGISLCYLVQNYKSKSGGISRAIRNNITNAIIFKNKDEKELEYIATELAGEIDKETFFKVYDIAIDEPYSFLFVDLHKKDNHPSMFRKRFDTFIIP